MQDIDFLPTTYRELHRQRRATVVRLVLLVSVAGTIMLAALTQHAERRSLMARLANMQLLHKEATARQAMLTDLEGKLERANAEAALLTFLRHPWPKSQILTEIVAPLPEAVTLERLEFIAVEKPVDTAQQRAFSPSPPTADQTVPEKLAAVEDLEALRQEVNDVENQIRISGQTSDHAALHRYLLELGQSKLLLKPHLESVDSVQGEDESAIRFTAHIAVRPSLGATPKPTAEEAAPSAIAQRP